MSGEQQSAHANALERKHNSSVAAKVRYSDPSERAKTSKSLKGKLKSAEHKAKLSEARRAMLANTPKQICPVCGFAGHVSILAAHRKRKGH